MITEEQILNGRKVVDAYRAAHSKLYEQGWHKFIPEKHTPLLNTMLVDLKKQGFNSLDEFFAASELLNIQELGFASKRDFETKVKEGSTTHIEINSETGEEIEVIKLPPGGRELLNKLNGMWK